MTYKTKKFDCKLCGITFTVESDSKIDEQKICSRCKNCGYSPEPENGRAVKRPPKKP